MDFIIKLPEFTGFNTVIIVANLVFKRTHFISIHTIIITESTMRLFIHNVWKLHGFPIHVVLDRRP